MTRTFITRWSSTLLVGAIAVAAFAAVQDITLKHRPKVGDVSSYKSSANFTTPNGDITFSQNSSQKVTEVKSSGGFVVKTTTSNTKISFGGQDLPEQPEATSTSEFGPDGLLTSITAETAPDASSYRIANLHAFKAPDVASKIGDEIKFEIPGDKTKETPGVKAVYKVVALEKVKDWDTVKLTFTSEETEGDTKASIKGTAWLNAADGSMVKVEEEWKDVQPAGAPFPVSGKFTTERVK